MKKVKRRATAALLIAALLVVGLSVYLVRLADDGGAWASYFNGGTPGGTILLAAHRDIETITIDREVQKVRDSLIPEYATLVYNGFWFAPEREAIQALVTKSQETVNGEVRLKLYKGNVMYAGRRSPQSLYSEEIATMEGGHEELYNQDDAEGFIHLNGLRLKQFSRVNKPYGN